MQFILDTGGNYQMPSCSYCGKMYDIPRGLTLVMLDGTVKHLCSSKCRKNMKMKRRKVRWISKMKQTKAEELAAVIEESKEPKKMDIPEEEGEKKEEKKPEKAEAKKE